MSEDTDFSNFGLAPQLQSAISKMGYQRPTPIQVKAIPLVLEGKDVMGAAQTGTGKTAGFGLPLLQKILPLANSSTSPARHPVRALILSPTRELADQTSAALTNFASDSQLRVGVVYGGVDIAPQSDMLRKGVEVLIATPGRLLDHLEQKSTNLSQVQIVVLDEADRMMDMGFLPDITRILKALPGKRQSLMFSATFSPEIKKLAQSYLKNPVLVEVARQNATASTIKEVVYSTHNSEKTEALIQILNQVEKDSEEPLQTIVFVNAKITAYRLSRQLEKAGFKFDSIHGDRTQEERTATLQNFKNGQTNVLVATDVAARGLDIAELPLVINYDVPFMAEDYVHRIGRTGRAGSKGLAITLTTPTDEKFLQAIEALTKKQFKIEPIELDYRCRGSNRRASKVYTYEPPVRYEDPFFAKPYVPQSKTVTGTINTTSHSSLSHSIKAKTPVKVSVLLGGSGRKD